MAQLKYEIQMFCVCVPLNKRQWDRLQSLETIQIIKALESAGAYLVDWDGHFGRNVYFRAEADTRRSPRGLSNVRRVMRQLEILLAPKSRVRGSRARRVKRG